MAKCRSKPKSSRSLTNQRRTSFAAVLSSASHRAHEQANRRGGKRATKSVWATIAATEIEHEAEPAEWPRRLLRWSLAVALLPLCWVTAWTLLSQFSQAKFSLENVEKAFWLSTEFWYFATGALLMVGWFWSGLFQSFFLYLYVLGHELTHAFFVLVYRGKVTEFHVSSEGGYITTNKTNLVIALSPYFVPFWSAVFATIYAITRHFSGSSSEWDRVFYAAMGLTWAFHMVWTIWMIPRDQPDLKENGTFLSLVVIFLANLLVLAGLLCVARESPLKNSKDFGMEWLRHAATWGDVVLRWSHQCIVELRTAGRL